MDLSWSVTQGWKGDETYICKMVNDNVDEDIREDPLLADILMDVKQDASYTEASLALRQCIYKVRLKTYPMHTEPVSTCPYGSI